MTKTERNWTSPQGENIADNGGLREALLAYFKYVERNGEEPRLPGLEEYTTSQLFFLANANIWCGSITTEGLLNQVCCTFVSSRVLRVVHKLYELLQMKLLRKDLHSRFLI